jgi:hypothetical protein
LVAVDCSRRGVSNLENNLEVTKYSARFNSGGGGAIHPHRAQTLAAARVWPRRGWRNPPPPLWLHPPRRRGGWSHSGGGGLRHPRRGQTLAAARVWARWGWIAPPPPLLNLAEYFVTSRLFSRFETPLLLQSTATNQAVIEFIFKSLHTSHWNLMNYVILLPC